MPDLIARLKEFVRTNHIKETGKVSWRLLKIVWGVDPKLFILFSFVLLIPAVLPFINAYIFKLLIDFIVAVVSGSKPFVPTTLYILIALRVVTYMIQDFAFTAQRFLSRIIWLKVPITLNDMILRKTSHLDMYYFENSEFKETFEKALDSYSWRPQNIIQSLLMGFQSLLQLIIALVALAKLSWWIIPLMLLIAVPEFINEGQFSKLSFGIWTRNSPERKRFHYITHRLLENARAVSELKIFHLADRFLDELKQMQIAFYQENNKVSQTFFKRSILFTTLSNGAYLGIEVLILFRALTRVITVGDISFYTSVVRNFQSALEGSLRNINSLFEHSLYVSSMFELLDVPSVIKQPENPVVLLTKKAPKIEFKHVDFAYPGSNRKTLKDFSLIIEPGEKIAFVGENGAGKSTIIKLLARFYDVTAGEILIDGIDIRSLDLESWYRHFGVLFQDFNRYEHTALENIHFGDTYKAQNLEQIMKAAVPSGAHPVISQLDQKYDQMLGSTFKDAVELSTGQWQKIALARAFFRNAPVLVLDEPTSAIDAKAESEIFNRVEKLSKEKSVIIISHRFSTVRNADKIYVIDNGKIVESGSHEKLMQESGRYARLFQLQARGYQ